MTDQDLLRFLRARQFNLKKASKMLDDTCEHRKQHQVTDARGLQASKMLEDTCEYRKQHQPDRLLVTDHVNICKQ
ncbi:hypothetical protein T484DRAFT_1843414, partial [Baffinella frigidus]